MKRRRLRRLYADALASYVAGYVDGASAQQSYVPLGGMDDERPAYEAGNRRGQAKESFDRSRLPLDVWVRVLARDQRP